MPATITVLDSAGATQTVNTLPALGQVAKAAAIPVALASDDSSLALLGATTETAPASDTGTSGNNGRLQRIAQRLTSLIALTPASLGQKTMTASMAVVVASDQSAVPVSAVQLPAALGPTTSGACLAITPGTDNYQMHTANSSSVLLSAAATTNATSVKASGGAVKGIQGYNAKTAAVFLKLYDKATAPTVGTDTPVKTLYLPAGTAFAFDFNFKFATGIAYALTGLAANADTSALVAADIQCLNVDYI